MQWYVAELLRFGAIHWCPVAPAPPTSGERWERLSPEERAAAQRTHDAGVAAWGKSVRFNLPEGRFFSVLCISKALTCIPAGPQRRGRRWGEVEWLPNQP